MSSSNSAIQATPASKALACKLLSQAYQSQTFLPGTPDYERARSTFWNKTQAESSPVCVFQPNTAGEVSIALIVLRSCSCPFAVKSGGHGKFNGESTMDDGVLIDLAEIRHVKVAKDRGTVTVGPGNRWNDVFSAIEPLGLTVVGGRAAGVGVGGFLLGGGISWYSNLYGLGADNIRSYEVVLANGVIITASKSSNPDLYRALRGGAGNFGIVTSFTLEAFPYSGMWAGRRAWAYAETETNAITDNFLKTGAISNTQDPKAFAILALTTTPEKEWVWGTSLVYCDSVENPVAFDEIRKCPPGLLESGALRHQTDLIAELNLAYPTYLQHTLWTIAVKIDLELLRFCAQTWVSEFQPILDEVEGCKAQLAIQYITSGMLEGATRNGGNILGLGTEPFLMLNAEPHWVEATDNPRVFAAIDTAFTKMTAEAKRRGLGHDYVYSNYASQYQDPIGSYGTEANQFMNEVSRKYDPGQVFQQLRGAGFKFSGSPQAVRSLRNDARL